MPVYIAQKTLDAIEVAIEKDQGAAFRKFLGEAIKDVSDAYDPKLPEFRSHFGISQSGEECARKLWYNWRWVKLPRFPGRIMRLFNRGHLEEARFVAIMRTIGCTLYQADENQKQYRVSYFGGHYGSAIDGVVIGIPDLPDPSMPALAEFKTHGEKSFVSLQSKGLFAAHKKHYIQMQQYMGYYKLNVGLYLAVNKNTDELYAELIEYDPDWDQYSVNRSKQIIFAKVAPPRYSDRPSDFECRYCDHKMLCHYGQSESGRNCRTCQQSVPLEDGTWACGGTGEILDKQAQLAGCQHWLKHPDV